MTQIIIKLQLTVNNSCMQSLKKTDIIAACNLSFWHDALNRNDRLSKLKKFCLKKKCVFLLLLHFLYLLADNNNKIA